MPSLTIGRHHFPDVTYVGAHDPELSEIIESLAEPLRGYLRQHNGWIALGGALHVRGACLEPAWHSFTRARAGLKRGYPLGATDVCVAQDGLGNQFVSRAGRIWRLAGETGAWHDLATDLDGFFAAALADPDRWLGRHHLRGVALAPGQLALAYPPLCTDQARSGVSVKAVAVDQVLGFHAQLARQLADLPPGASIQIKPTE